MFLATGLCLFGKTGLRLSMLEGLFGKAGSAVCEAGSASAVRYFFFVAG